MSRRAAILRAASWAILVVGIAGAVLLWISAREVTEVTRRVVGHATIEFQDLEVRISVARIALGIASLVGGVFLWALGRAVADLTGSRLPTGTERRPGVDRPGG